MYTIYKYPFDVSDSVSITMPSEAKILCVQMQDKTPCLWAMVNPTGVIETRYFKVIGTGHKVDQPENLIYIGTFQELDGLLIWHLFELK